MVYLLIILFMLSNYSENSNVILTARFVKYLNPLSLEHRLFDHVSYTSCPSLFMYIPACVISLQDLRLKLISPSIGLCSPPAKLPVSPSHPNKYLRHICRQAVAQPRCTIGSSEGLIPCICLQYSYVRTTNVITAVGCIMHNCGL